MSISALGGVSSFDFYNSSSIQSMYDLMRYQYSINSSLASRNASKVSSYLGTQGLSTSTSGVDNTTAFLSLYKSDLTGMEKAADRLSYYKPGNVFSEFTLGSSDEGVAEISTKSLSRAKEFTVDVQNLATDIEPARYSITENGKTTQYTSKSNTISLSNADATMTLKGTGTTSIYTGVDEDNIVSAMKDMVKKYNDTMETLSVGKSLGSGVYSQISDMSKRISNGTVLSMVGLSYDKNGNLSLDEARLRSQLEKDYDTTREIIGGQYGIATGLSQKADEALSKSVTSIMGRSLSGNESGLLGSGGSIFGQSADLGQDYLNLMFDFSKKTPYAYNNLYAVGSMLNLLG